MTDDAAAAEESAGVDDSTTADTDDSPDETDAAFPEDDRRRQFLRGIAEEIRDESSESRQLSAILYRVSDLYDPEEDTSPEEIYLNVRNIMQVKARGGLDR